MAEDLHLRIMDIVTAAGTSFAFPSQTTYVESGTGMDRERTKTVEEQVNRWRERGELCVPRFPKSLIERIDDTIPYPPAGSAVSGSEAA